MEELHSGDEDVDQAVKQPTPVEVVMEEHSYLGIFFLAAMFANCSFLW